MRIVNAGVFYEDTFVEKDIWISKDKFTNRTDDNQVIDASGCYAIPGLIDLHTHGCVNGEYSFATQAKMTEMLAYQARNGITAVCATLMTLPEAALSEACLNIANRDNKKECAQVVGIYLEGPFVSREKLGAQNSNYATLPDAGLYYRLQKDAKGLVKILSVAPELEGAMEMIDELNKRVICTIAHTAADYDVAKEAINRGARQVTHLYNAMSPLLSRAPGVVGAAMEDNMCKVELICDGIHVHPAVVNATFRMFGEDNIIFISDSMMATGLSDGDYKLGGLEVTVKNRTAKLKADNVIAGSVTNLMDCLRTAIAMGIPIGKAVKCASTNPAKAIGAYDELGSITEGKIANLVLLNKKNLSIKQVILNGILL